MANPMAALRNLITLQPEQLRPIFTHVETMLNTIEVSFHTHVQDNETTAVATQN